MASSRNTFAALVRAPGFGIVEALHQVALLTLLVVVLRRQVPSGTLDIAEKAHSDASRWDNVDNGVVLERVCSDSRCHESEVSRS